MISADHRPSARSKWDDRQLCRQPARLLHASETGSPERSLYLGCVTQLRTPATNLSLYLELLERATPQKRVEYQSILMGQSRLL